MYTEIDNSTRIYFVNINNENEYILISITDNDRSVITDTEDVDIISSITINGKAGQLFKKGELWNLIFTDPSTGCTFLLQSQINQDELIKVAEGISEK